MSKVLVTEQYLSDIAGSIRTKNGTLNTYTPAQMAAAIDALPDPTVLVEKIITEAGTYNAVDDSADGYSKITNNILWYVEPYIFDWHPNGYVMNSMIQFNGSSVNYSDVYKTIPGHRYIIALGANKGSRWRGAFTDIDVSTITDPSYQIPVTLAVNSTNPAARREDIVTAPNNGTYFVITKDNAGKSGVKTYLFDITKQNYNSDPQPVIQS